MKELRERGKRSEEADGTKKGERTGVSVIPATRESWHEGLEVVSGR